MASNYSQIFSLTDIFNNPKLKDKLPMINTKEDGQNNAKNSKSVSFDTVINQIFETATNAASQYFQPLSSTKVGNTIVFNGEGDESATADAIYNALNSIKVGLTWTANNADILSSAIKETEKNKRNNGINSKLYLRVQSMQQIEGMSTKQLQGLMDNIMENILYGDDFPETQKKFKVEQLNINSPYNYNQRKLRWKYRVGDV